MIMDRDARLAAADAILDRGVRFVIPHAPVRLRLLGLDRLHIRPLRAGTILAISKVVLEAKLEDAILLEDHAFLATSIEPIARCVALAYINSRRLLGRFTDQITRLMLLLPVDVLIRIFLQVDSLNQKQHFMTITRWFVVQTQMMMNQRHQGQDQGS